MVHIAKTMGEYQMKRRKNIQNLNEAAKHLDLLKKMAAHQKQSGTPLFQGYKKKSTLEDALDKSKIDENLEKKIVAMGGKVPVAKAWIQSLEPVVKEFVLDRWPAYQKLFEKNFGVVNVVNLKANFRLFKTQQLEAQKAVQVPSRDAIIKVLEAANPLVADRFLAALIRSNVKVERWFNRIPIGAKTRPSDVIMNFLGQYSDDADAFSTIAYVGSRFGLVFPTVKVEAGEEDDVVKIGETNGDLSTIDPQDDAYMEDLDSFMINELGITDDGLGETGGVSGSDLDSDSELDSDSDSELDSDGDGFINPDDDSEVNDTAKGFKLDQLNRFLENMYRPESVPSKIKQSKKSEKVRHLADNGFNFITEKFSRL
jgi:hypothetical protein